MPAGYITVPALTVADIAMFSGRIDLLGFAVTEDAAVPAAASFVIRDGTTAGAPIVFPVKLAASQSYAFWFGDIDNGGLALRNGLYFDMLSGSINGAVYIG